MYTQLTALLTVRLLMLRHQFLRGKALSIVLNAIMVLFFTALALGVGAGMLMLGLLLGDRITDAGVFLIAADLVLVMLAMGWLAATIADLERFDAIDLRRMLFLPVSLRMCFTLNLVSSLFSPFYAFYFLGIMGFIAGLSTHLGPVFFLIGFLLAAAFLLMLGAWTYYFKGALAILLENKRRRRAVMSTVGAIMILVFQIPALGNLFVRDAVKSEFVRSAVRENNSEALIETVRMVNVAVPLCWLPYGLASALEGRYLAALACVAGLSGLTAAGGALGYRSLHRHYLGIGKRPAKPSAVPAARTAPRKNALAEFRLPGFADDTAAYYRTNLMLLLRAPFARFLIVGYLLITVFLCGAVAYNFQFFKPDDLAVVEGGGEVTRTGTTGQAAQPGAEAAEIAGKFLWYGALLGAFWFNMQSVMLYMNVFGYDQDGFRTLALLPTSRARILIGKNLTVLSVIAPAYTLFLLLYLALTTFSIAGLVMSVLLFVQQSLLFCMLGNLVSIYFPFRLRSDALRPAGGKGAGTIGGLAMLFAMPAAAGPSAIVAAADGFAAAMLDAPPYLVGAAGGAAILAATILLYWLHLPMAGRLLQTREERILDAFRKDKE